MTAGSSISPPTISCDDLTESDLRRLFEMMKQSHPDILSAALSFMNLKPKPVQAPVAAYTDDSVVEDTKSITAQNEKNEIPIPAPKNDQSTRNTAEEGCYLVYDSDSCKLMLYYSKSPVERAIGFWSPGPGKKIQEFKFQQNFGRSELIGNCASGVEGRKNYYSGWCQFVRGAKALDGSVSILPCEGKVVGLDVDIFAYYKNGRGDDAQQQTIKFEENASFAVSDIDAVACLPKHTDFFVGLNKVKLSRWYTDGCAIGAASVFLPESEFDSVAESEKQLKSTPAFQSPSTSETTPQVKKEASFPKSALTPQPPKIDTAKNVQESNNAIDGNKVPPPLKAPIRGTEAGEIGCYLLYDSDSCKIMIHYSKTPVTGALGFWSPGPNKQIQEFKFQRNFGRSELIGNCASGVQGRKNYYSGWCQFVRAAKALDGSVRILPCEGKVVGLDVDVFVYYQNPNVKQTVKLDENATFDVSDIDAVACLPKHTDFFEGLNTVKLSHWCTKGSTIGAASSFSSTTSTTTTAVPKSVNKYKPQAVKPSSATPAAEQKPATSSDGCGCYLVYDADLCKLMIHYSKTPVPDAIGFWSPGVGKKIQGFKFNRNSGRSELIGNCAAGVAGRKNYYSGWCQFVRAAKALNGSVIKFPDSQGQSLDVDVYIYFKNCVKGGLQSFMLEENVDVDVVNADAVACLPKHTDFFGGTLTIDLNRWMTEGSTTGAASRLT